MSSRQTKTRAASESIETAAYQVMMTSYFAFLGLVLIAFLAAALAFMTGLPYEFAFYGLLATALIVTAVLSLRSYRRKRRDALARERRRQETPDSPTVYPVGTPSWY
ncbi:MAG: hypothetical protein AB7W16_21200 [Candidatus Obscuribacterales bacterium]